MPWPALSSGFLIVTSSRTHGQYMQKKECDVCPWCPYLDLCLSPFAPDFSKEIFFLFLLDIAIYMCNCIAYQYERFDTYSAMQLLYHNLCPFPSPLYKGFLFLFFEMEFHSCYPGQSAMAQSRLTIASASWVQAILLSQPLEQLALQARATMPS